MTENEAEIQRIVEEFLIAARMRCGACEFSVPEESGIVCGLAHCIYEEVE